MNKWYEAALRQRAVMDNAGAMLTDVQAASVPSLYRKWESGIHYDAGERRKYGGILYRCLQAHTALPTWTPDVSPSQWAKVLIPGDGTIPEWEQPDSTNTYSKGDIVTHNGQTWISIVDNNSWEPGVYGWEVYDGI